MTEQEYKQLVSVLPEEETKDPDVSSFPEEDQAWHLNNHRLTKAIKAMNKNANGGEIWKANIHDGRQQKWWPVFQGRGSSFVFRSSLTLYDYTFSCVGSRFLMISEEVSDEAAEKLFEMYEIERLK